MVNQTKLSNEASPLLDTAISRLRPEVFSHPIWIRFGCRDGSIPPDTKKALLIEAENLRRDNPRDACQVLLISAVHQHYSGQSDEALSTIREVERIAERRGLDEVLPWALWGACAICVQKQRFEQAAVHLTSLMHRLSDQDNWILADFVDVVKQILLQQQTNTGNKTQIECSEKHSTGNILAYTFHWLNRWGLSAQTQKSEPCNADQQEQPGHRSAPRSSFKDWHSLRLLFRGELKLNWLDDNRQHVKKRSAFWGHILSFLHLEAASQGQEYEPGTGDRAEAEVMAHEDKDIAPTIIPETRISEDIPLSISAQMLGDFNLTIQETTLDLPSSRSLSLLKYLLLNHKQKTPREMLLEIFWPDTAMERGRNNLNVAMNSIRTAFRTITDRPVVLYKDNAYGIAPEIKLWVDVEEFEGLVDSGNRLEARNRMSSAISDYEAAISLYQGDFLEQNPYENWTVLPRERLRSAYLVTLDRLSQIYYRREQYAMCITLSQLILNRDRCREDAHSMLMRCYNLQGQDYLALRQYQACADALRLELDVSPSPETTELFEQIRQHNRV